jgi:hypothetical protein
MTLPTTQSGATWSDHLWSGVQLAGAGTAVVAAWYWKHLWRKVLSTIRKDLTLRDSHAIDASIWQLISELRVRATADRVSFCQFQNGEHFSTTMIGWKVVTTHEVHDAGVEPTTVFQIILASRVQDMLGPMFARLQDPRSNPNATAQNRAFTICLKTEEMQPGFARWLMESRGVHHTILAPIFRVDSRNGEVPTGLIKLEYLRSVPNCLGGEPKCPDCENRHQVLETARQIEMAMFARKR